MRKILFFALCLAFGLTLTKYCQAFTLDQVENFQAPAQITYKNDFDLLVMDFSIPGQAGKNDYLQAITLQNIGTAGVSEIKKVYVWKDQGEIGFQGMTIDKKLGEALIKDGQWVLSGINEKIPESGLRLFVSVDMTTSTIANKKFIQFRISQKYDANNNGVYESGDVGIFTSLGNTGPENGSIDNFATQEVRTNSGDLLPPHVSFTNLLNNSSIVLASSLSIEGLTKDRMGGSVSQVAVSISNDPDNHIFWQEAALDSVGSGLYKFVYLWHDFTAGTYYITLRATDAVGNVQVNDQVKIIVTAPVVAPVSPGTQQISLTNSEFTINRDLAVIQEGFDVDLYAKVVLKDIQNNPLSNKEVILQSVREGVISQNTITTDNQGYAVWGIAGTKPGLATFSIIAYGQQLLSHPQVKFVDASLGGSLAKISDSSTVYLIKDNKRYFFPNSAVYYSYYFSFDNVQTISNTQMAAYSLSGNITFRPGTLIKLQTVPKVYRVNENKVLNWLETESVARRMYGLDWASLVYDVDDVYFANYVEGVSIK